VAKDLFEKVATLWISFLFYIYWNKKYWIKTADKN
jgi:hypothetical protein